MVLFSTYIFSHLLISLRFFDNIFEMSDLDKICSAFNNVDLSGNEKDRKNKASLRRFVFQTMSQVLFLKLKARAADFLWVSASTLCRTRPIQAAEEICSDSLLVRHEARSCKSSRHILWCYFVRHSSLQVRQSVTGRWWIQLCPRQAGSMCPSASAWAPRGRGGEMCTCWAAAVGVSFNWSAVFIKLIWWSVWLDSVTCLLQGLGVSSTMHSGYFRS